VSDTTFRSIYSRFFFSSFLGVRQALLHGSYLGLVTNSYVFKKGKTFIYQDKKMPQKHRVRNWNAYNKALKLRGDLFLYFDENFLKNEWFFDGKRKSGGKIQYSDAVIEMMLSIKNVLRMPLRQAQGFVESILNRLELPLRAPDYTTVSRRAKTLSLKVKVLGVRHHFPFNLFAFFLFFLVSDFFLGVRQALLHGGQFELILGVRHHFPFNLFDLTPPFRTRSWCQTPFSVQFILVVRQPLLHGGQFELTPPPSSFFSLRPAKLPAHIQPLRVIDAG
jgi:hypothetical protein